MSRQAIEDRQKLEKLMAWAEDYRQNWIAETLRVFGYINREHLMLKFGISRGQAALDFTRFQSERPGVMTYDKSEKRYVGTTMSVGVARAMDNFTKKLATRRAASN
jgi:hypothetical protein